MSYQPEQYPESVPPQESSPPPSPPHSPTAPAPSPNGASAYDPVPQILVTALTEGYVLQFGGRSVAASTPGQVARKIKELFAALEVARGKAHPSAVAGRQRPVRMSQPRAPQTQATPPISPGPAVTSPVATDGESGEPAIQIDLRIAKQNLTELAKRRVAGQITDAQFFEFCKTYCVGIPEDICADFLDATMENAPPPWVPGDNVQSLADAVQAQQNGFNSQGQPLQVGGNTPGLIEDVRPQDLVDDFVSDEYGNPLRGVG